MAIDKIDVWQLGQNTKAADLYKDSKLAGFINLMDGFQNGGFLAFMR